jgi:hypothetical protein
MNNKRKMKKKKRAGGVTQEVDLEFKPQYLKKKKVASNSLSLLLPRDRVDSCPPKPEPACWVPSGSLCNASY